MHYDIVINGLPVHAVYTEENIRQLFLPLLVRLTELQRSRGRRIVAFLAAPPGAGKSTLASFLQELSRQTDGVQPLTVIGMDGFHRRQEYLLSHTAVRDGKELRMVEIKGAPETFDLEKFTDAVKRLAAGEDFGWPLYDRTLHNPVEDAVRVSGSIVLLEGNYLLLDRPGWRDLRQYADLTICLTAGEEMLRRRLTDRKEASGTERAKAERFVDFSDMANVRVCLRESAPADLRWTVRADGSFEEI